MVDIFDVDIAGNPLDGTPGAFSATVTAVGTIQSVLAGDTLNIVSFSEVPDATTYTIYWKTSAGVTTADNQITGVTSPYSHTSLSNGTTYYYVYTATVAGIESGISNELSGTPSNGLDQTLYATYSNDITTTAFGTWSGHSIGPQDVNFRAVVTFNISTIPVGASITSLQFTTTSYWVSANGSDTYYIGPYNGDGSGVPATDGFATAYTRADCSADYYLSGDTSYRSTGTQTVSLGAQAITDLLAIRSGGGTTFTIAMRQATETGTYHYATFEGRTAGNDAPKLLVNSTAPSVLLYPVLFCLRT